MSERTPREWLLAVEQYPLRGGVSTDFEAALAAWRADRARIAVLEAQRDALVPLAEAYTKFWNLYRFNEDINELITLVARHYDAVFYSDFTAAAAALAAIAAERKTATEGGQDDA